MAYIYADLLNYINTGSGVGEYCYLAPVRWFTASGIKCPVAPFTSPGDEVTIYEDHIFVAGKGFVKYLMAPEKNQLDAITIGQKGSQKFEQSLKIFIPGSYAEVHEALKNLLNEPLIVLIPDSECESGIMYQLGCSCSSAWLKADFKTGTTVDGIKGYEATISHVSDSVLIYEGDIQLITGSVIVGIFGPEFAPEFE